MTPESHALAPGIEIRAVDEIRQREENKGNSVFTWKEEPGSTERRS